MLFRSIQQSLFPTSTKEEDQQRRLIPILQSICRNMMRFCASHGQPVLTDTELEEGQAARPQFGSGNKEEEEEQGEVVVAGGDLTGEHQRSPTADVEATKTNRSEDCFEELEELGSSNKEEEEEEAEEAVVAGGGDLTGVHQRQRSPTADVEANRSEDCFDDAAYELEAFARYPGGGERGFCATNTV